MSAHPSTPPSSRARRYLGSTTPWLPIALTVTAVATVGLAVWTWYATPSSGSDDATSESRSGTSTQPAQTRDEGVTKTPARKVIDPRSPRRMVAVVISAQQGALSAGCLAEDILSALPTALRDGSVQLVVLIYAPRKHRENDQENEISDSVTDIDRLQSLGKTAARLVEREEMVMTFSTPSGYVHILRHLKPAHVLVEGCEGLLGGSGEIVQQLAGWVGKVDVLVSGEQRVSGLANNGAGVGQMTIYELDNDTQIWNR